jgi:AcrR family transcriptional regulator
VSGASLPEPLYERLPPGPGKDPETVAASQFERLCGAMAYAIAERSYERLSVRELCALAGVAPKTLYRHFPGGVHECFLGAHEHTVQRAVGLIAAACEHERDPQERLRAAIGAFAREVAERPQAARLVLCASLYVSAQTRQATRRTAAVSAQALGKLVGGARPEDASPLLAAAIVAGVTHVARERLLVEGAPGRLVEQASELAEWVLGCRRALESAPAGVQLPLAQAGDMTGPARTLVPRSADEQSKLTRAAIELLAEGDELRLNAETLAAKAMVPKRRVQSLFGGCRPCLFSAIERLFADLLSELGGNRPAEARRMIKVLLTRLAGEHALARALFLGLPCLGRDGVLLRQSLIGSLTLMLANGAPPSPRFSRLELEASTGALWGMIEQQLTTGGPARLPALLGLACLFVAPAVTAPRTLNRPQLAPRERVSRLLPAPSMSAN